MRLDLANVREVNVNETVIIAPICGAASVGHLARGLRHAAAPTGADRPAAAEFRRIRDHPLLSALDANFGLPDLTDAYRVEGPDQYETQPDGTVVYNYLALSGGGSAGAFGAGILNGWTAKGDRPKFKVVTGVSTGALISTFAFLGSDYDDELKEAYTTVDASHIYVVRNLFSILWSESATDNKPFRDMINKYLTEKVLDEVAAEHKKGRRLYIMTTDLDRELPVVWDLGAIASSSSPRRLALYRQVVLASASIPAVFPPVLINVTVDGKPYDELHVDGGVFAQSFFIGNALDLKKTVHDAHPDWNKDAVQRLYVIRNGRIDAQTRVTNREAGVDRGQFDLDHAEGIGHERSVPALCRPADGRARVLLRRVPGRVCAGQCRGVQQGGNEQGVRPGLQVRQRRRAMAAPAARLSSLSRRSGPLQERARRFNLEFDQDGSRS